MKMLLLAGASGLDNMCDYLLIEAETSEVRQLQELVAKAKELLRQSEFLDKVVLSPTFHIEAGNGVHQLVGVAGTGFCVVKDDFAFEPEQRMEQRKVRIEVMSEGGPFIMVELAQEQGTARVELVKPMLDRLLEEPRFYQVVGMHDVPKDALIIDRRTREVVMRLHPAYQQLLVLETTTAGRHPFTDMVDWLNSLDDDTLASEDIPNAPLQ